MDSWRFNWWNQFWYFGCPEWRNLSCFCKSLQAFLLLKWNISIFSNSRTNVKQRIQIFIVRWLWTFWNIFRHHRLCSFIITNIPYVLYHDMPSFNFILGIDLDIHTFHSFSTIILRPKAKPIKYHNPLFLFHITNFFKPKCFLIYGLFYSNTLIEKQLKPYYSCITVSYGIDFWFINSWRTLWSCFKHMNF